MDITDNDEWWDQLWKVHLMQKMSNVKIGELMGDEHQLAWHWEVNNVVVAKDPM